jgi:LEA14-like dessication related protein
MWLKRKCTLWFVLQNKSEDTTDVTRGLNSKKTIQWLKEKGQTDKSWLKYQYKENRH